MVAVQHRGMATTTTTSAGGARSRRMMARLLLPVVLVVVVYLNALWMFSSSDYFGSLQILQMIDVHDVELNIDVPASDKNEAHSRRKRSKPRRRETPQQKDDDKKEEEEKKTSNIRQKASTIRGQQINKRPILPLQWTRNNYTFDSFEVAGINLAAYGLKAEDGVAMVNDDKARISTTNNNNQHQQAQQPVFELYDDFDLSQKIVGNETWKDLVAYRRDVERPSLSFFVDKVARKRWLPSVGLPSPKAFVLKYASELTATGDLEDEQAAIHKLLLNQQHPVVLSDFAAKPTHLSCSGGVWLTKYDAKTNTTLISHGTKPFAKPKDGDDVNQQIVESLARDLHEGPRCGRQIESWALYNVKPGFMIEERFTDADISTSAAAGDTSNDGVHNDNVGGMEFKVVTIWGRVWLAQWRPGVSKVRAFICRDGTTLYFDEEQSHALPDWVDWPRIVAMAEQLGAHKDMFRTDIFVGVPVGTSSLLAAKKATRQERLDAVQYVVSETEVHPTPLKGCGEIFDEAGRLWLAGYAIGNYKVVPNTEVPKEFLDTGMLSIQAKS